MPEGYLKGTAISSIGGFTGQLYLTGSAVVECGWASKDVALRGAAGHSFLPLRCFWLQISPSQIAARTHP